MNAAQSSSAETRFPPLGDFVAVDGARIHLLDRGAKDRTAIVLIHGASGNLRDFGFGFSEKLLEKYRVIAVDRPGHGHSDRGRADAHRPDVQAALLRQAVQSRGVNKAIILGHSLGNAVALSWALDAPDSVAGLVDLAGVAMPWPGGVDLQYRLADTPLLGRLTAHIVSALVSEGYVEEQIANIFAPQQPPEDYTRTIGAPLAVRPGNFRWNGQDVRNLKPFLAALSKRYAQLSMPVEILHGDKDSIVPASVHAEPLSRLAPKSRLTLLSGVGHMPHHAAQKTVLAAIDRLSQA